MKPSQLFCALLQMISLLQLQDEQVQHIFNFFLLSNGLCVLNFVCMKEYVSLFALIDIITTYSISFSKLLSYFYHKRKQTVTPWGFTGALYVECCSSS